ncbi:hypothetical protein HYS54_02720 [Candidatus Micrarchaeota archaeon]|nr:hypothetical protein [Candidatus Micrarchaeota archaeon]
MEGEIDWEKVKNRMTRLFSPSRSSIRAYIGALATRNAFILSSGGKLDHRPTTNWFKSQLNQLGITHNYFSVRNNLKILVDWGVLEEKEQRHTLAGPQRLVQNAKFYEYYLPDLLAPALREVLLVLFGASSLGDIFRSGLPDNNTNGLVETRLLKGAYTYKAECAAATP